MIYMPDSDITWFITSFKKVVTIFSIIFHGTNRTFCLDFRTIGTYLGTSWVTKFFVKSDGNYTGISRLRPSFTRR